MTKIEKLITAAKIVEAAQQEIAYARGMAARAHNRPKTGVLVPKFDTVEELSRFQDGWETADNKLAA